MRYLLKIAYDGTNYKGWQSQKEKKTIQSVLEEKLRITLREKIKLFAAGRTDRGVHAEMQCAHFDSNKLLEENKTQYSLNALLKEEAIIIKDITRVNEDFHARFSCKMKEYKYQLLIGYIHDVFKKNQYWLIPKFDIIKAQECGKLIEGTHDFSSLRDSQCQALSPIKTIIACEFKTNKNFVEMKIKAKSFLHHQIRILIGTIVQIITKNEPSSKILEILGKKARLYAGPTAPAKGLFLSKIKY